MDKTDKKILFELDVNARVSNRQLAKKTGVSEQVINYRIKRLLENKAIKNFYSIVNMGALGFENFRVYFRLQNLSPEKEQTFLNYLVKDPLVIWIAQCRGHWDLVVSFSARNIFSFSKTFKKILERFDHQILTKNIAVIEKAEHFPRQYLFPKETTEKAATFFQVMEQTKLDAIDTKILFVLAHNSRIPFLELAHQLGLSSDTVSQRVKRLKEKNILMGYRALFNLPVIGYSNNIIILKLHYLNKKRLNAFFAFLRGHPNIVFALHCLGDHDIDLEVEVSSSAELDSFLHELRHKFSDIIRDLETLVVVNEPKFDFFPQKNP